MYILNKDIFNRAENVKMRMFSFIAKYSLVMVVYEIGYKRSSQETKAVQVHNVMHNEIMLFG